MCDRKGIICEGNEGMTPAKQEIAAFTNKEKRKGTLADAMKGADIFVGVSSAGIVSEEMVKSMNPGAIVMPMANPVPEIMPDLAKKAGAAVVGTAEATSRTRSNNVLAFPGDFPRRAGRQGEGYQRRNEYCGGLRHRFAHFRRRTHPRLRHSRSVRQQSGESRCESGQRSCRQDGRQQNLTNSQSGNDKFPLFFIYSLTYLFIGCII